MKTRCLLFLVALVARLFFLWHEGLGIVSFFGRERDPRDLSDSWDYIELARNIRRGFFGFVDPSAFRPPLYPALLALLNDNLYLVLIVQIILGALTALLVYEIALDRFGWQVAVISTTLFALAPMSARYTVFIMTETLFTFLLAVATLLWAKNLCGYAGGFFGLAALTRPIIVPFILILFAIGLLWKEKRKPYLIISLTACLIIGVWTARNCIVLGRFIPVSDTGLGTNLLFGSMESGAGFGVDWNKLAQDPVSQVDFDYHSPEKDRIYFARAVKIIESNPLGWLKVRAKQLPRFFVDSGAYLYTLLGPMFVAFKYSYVIAQLLLFVFAGYAVYSRRARLKDLDCLALFPIFLMLIHIPLWIESRYSLPIMPAVIMLAAAGLTSFSLVIHRYRYGDRLSTIGIERFNP